MSHQQKVYPRQSIALDRARAGACTIETATTESLPAGIGVATEVPSFTNLPMGVTSGSFTEMFDLTLDSSYNPAFETANGGHDHDLV